MYIKNKGDFLETEFGKIVKNNAELLFVINLFYSYYEKKLVNANKTCWDFRLTGCTERSPRIGIGPNNLGELREIFNCKVLKGAMSWRFLRF